MKSNDAEPPSPRPRWKQWLVERLDLAPRTRDDLIDELQRANANNILQGHVAGMMHGVMEFSVLQVRDIMMPRSQVDFIYHDDDFETIIKRISETEHSRYPVVDENRDDLIGILLAKDLLKYIGREKDDLFDIDDIIRPALLVPESQRLDRLMGEFRRSRNHMAIVIDEYAGVAGLVTFEDVLEQIVGEIDDEHDGDDEEDGNIRQQSERRYVIQATTPLDDFNQVLGTAFVSQEYDTVAGLVIDKLGHIPRQGEELDLSGLLFRVLRSDERRILLLEVLKKCDDDLYHPQAA